MLAAALGVSAGRGKQEQGKVSQVPPIQQQGGSQGGPFIPANPGVIRGQPGCGLDQGGGKQLGIRFPKGLKERDTGFPLISMGTGRLILLRLRKSRMNNSGFTQASENYCKVKAFSRRPPRLYWNGRFCRHVSCLIIINPSGQPVTLFMKPNSNPTAPSHAELAQPYPRTLGSLDR